MGGGDFPGGMDRCVAEFHPQYGVRNRWGTNLYLRCSERRCLRFKCSEMFGCFDWQIVAEDRSDFIVWSSGSLSWLWRRFTLKMAALRCFETLTAVHESRQRNICTRSVFKYKKFHEFTFVYIDLMHTAFHLIARVSKIKCKKCNGQWHSGSK